MVASKSIVIVTLFTILMTTYPQPEYTEPVLMRVTCYCPTGSKTATGIYPYEGICASNREHLGMVAAVYDANMNFIGYFECADTGGARSLRNGTSIDIFRNDMQGAREWVNTYGDYCYVQWLNGEG